MLLMEMGWFDGVLMVLLPPDVSTSGTGAYQYVVCLESGEWREG
jgi:hypothetical protein